MLWVELEAVDVFLVSDFMVFGKDWECVLVLVDFFFKFFCYGKSVGMFLLFNCLLIMNEWIVIMFTEIEQILIYFFKCLY
jgi:hypothetical protein